jgi:hypothetical protein
MANQAIFSRLRFQTKSLIYHPILPIVAVPFRDLFLLLGISTKVIG